MERYLGGEDIDQAVLIKDLEKAVAQGSFFPVIPVCSATGVGTFELLEVATSGFPSPLEHPLPEVYTPAGADRARSGLRPERPAACRGGEDDIGPLCRQSQPGPSVLRARSGPTRPCTCRDISPILRRKLLQRHGRTQPTTTRTNASGPLSFPLGKTAAARLDGGGRRRLRDRPADPRGDRGHVVGQGRTAGAQPWSMPEPLLPIAIASAREDRRRQAVGGLQRLAAEDPTLRIEQNQETHQIVLWCMGEAHAGVSSTLSLTGSV